MFNTMKKQCVDLYQRIVKDFQQKELLSLKLVFFVTSSTLYVLYPYLTIHMRELGINVEETAIMSSVIPIIGIVMPPIAGMAADKIGNFKLLLCILSSMGGLASLLLLIVPVGRITVTFPDEVVFSLGCNSTSITEPAMGNLQFMLAEDIPCNRTGHLSWKEAYLQTKMATCGVLCHSNQEVTGIPIEFLPRSSEEDDGELSVDSILKARSYTIRILDLETNEWINYAYNLTTQDVSHKQSRKEALSERFMKNNEHYTTAIRRISRNEYFLPAGDTYQMSCSEHAEDFTESSDFLLPTGARFSRMRRDTTPVTCRLDHGNVSSILSLCTDTDVDVWLDKATVDTADSGLYDVKYLQWNLTKINPTCMYQEKEEISATVHLHNPDNNMEIFHEIELEECQPRCIFTAARKDVCSNLQKEIIYDPSLTFWSYLVIRVFIGIIGGTSFAMFEGAVIALMREYKADYGLQRIYASIGGMISSPLAGALIDYASEGKGYIDFRPAFYLYAGLKVGSGVLLLLINLEFKKGAENVITDVMAVLRKAEVIALLLSCFILGTAWGYIESFLFWFLQDLGGTRSLMGLTITVGGIAGIPLLALSGPIIDKIGHANVIFIGFVFYAIRLLGYSMIHNPWHCLIFEAMEGVTSALSFTAAVTYAAKLSTATTDTSIQGLLGGIYFGVGKGAGSLVGGYMMKAFGTRPTYQIIAAFTLAMGCIYYLFNRFYIRKHPSEYDEKPSKDQSPFEDHKNVLGMNGAMQKNNGDVISRSISPSDNTEKDGDAHENAAYVDEEKTEEPEKNAEERNQTK